MYSKVLILTLAILLGCAFAASSTTNTVKLQMSGASNKWWLAVQPQNDNGDPTARVEVKDTSSTSYVTMQANPSWGFYTLTCSSGNGFKTPLTFRLTSTSGAQLTVQVNAIADALTDSGAQFGSSGSSTTKPPTSAPTSPATPPPRPTTAPATQKPTSAPATQKPTSAPTTKPTSAPATQKPTSAPATQKPTSAPATSAPVSGDLCAVTPTSSEPLKLLVPLYVYPGAAWDQVAAAASSVKIIAIINPNSGPLQTVDSSYSTYMTKLKNAGVELVGYVHTTYGERAIADVQADIDTYASKYPLVTGIFFDEAANEAAQVSYYTQAYSHAMGKSGYKHAILNPGVQPDQGYMNIATSIVIYEDYGSNLASKTYSSFVKCAPSAAQKAGYKYKFSGIVHTTTQADVASTITSLKNDGFGLVYVTDGAGGCCTYNTLASYFPAEATAVASANKS